jgi:hypothetical protein
VNCCPRWIVIIAASALLAACGPGNESAPAPASGVDVSASAASAPPSSNPLPDAVTASAQPARDLAEVVARWNTVADQSPVDLPAPFGRVTFTCDGEHFPHPTFKGGSAEAYGAFANVLLAFLQRDGNFDLLAANRLFTVNLRSGVPGPQGPDSGWTFESLLQDFSQPDSFGTHDAATRSALRAISERSRALQRS